MSCIMQAIKEASYSGMSFYERMDFYKVPALSVCVLEDGNIYTECFGCRDRENKIEADDETLFQAASISKVLLVIAVLRLAEAGKVDLDEDIRQYTDADFYKTFDCQDHRVTLRNLLSHTAGFNICMVWRSLLLTRFSEVNIRQIIYLSSCRPHPMQSGHIPAADILLHKK